MKITLKYGLVAVAVVACLTLMAVPATAGPRTVDCDKGDSLQKAIDAGAGSAKPIEIQLSGNCYEDIRISRDDVRIVGGHDATIIGDTRLYAADNVNLTDVKLTGQGEGIRIVNGRARLTNVHIAQNETTGISVRQSGMAVLRNCTIEANAEGGVIVDNASAIIGDSTIENNGGEGIFVTNNGFLSFDGGSVTNHEYGSGIIAANGSTIAVSDSHVGGNNPVGIALYMGSTGTVINTDAGANAAIGIDLETNSALEFFEGIIAWNGLYGAYVKSHSTLNLHTVPVEYNLAHGIVVESDGALFARGDTRIENNMAGDMVQIECRDEESSIELEGGVVVDPWPDGCSGF
jgi:hypothetical protein